MKAQTQTCLNGWWDFRPARSAQDESQLPADGWAEKAYLVPSLVNKSLCGVRKKGETHYASYMGELDERYASDEYEFLFDNHDYPVEWMGAMAGWARRTLHVDSIPAGTRRFLRFDAVAARCHVWLNGQKIAENNDAFLPLEVDITDHLHTGENELAVLILDYDRIDQVEEKKHLVAKTLSPSGNMLTAHMRGIWQDVWLVERGDVYVDDVILRTSFREKTLTVLAEVRNARPDAADVSLQLDVTDWAQDADAFAGASLLELPTQALSIPAGETASVEITVPWENPTLWQPESPHLYWLRAKVTQGDHQIDQLAERFGFREVWLDGPDFILNGFPVHFFSDWGHKVTQLHHTEAWNLAWFDLLKRENFNHSRLHTHPHPELIMDLADEHGILITGETGIHGSGGDQAADHEAYWANARDHIARYIKRDKNHPSLVLWSVENEMRWNQDKTERTKQELPDMYKLFRQLDPTREAYHEGDSSLWNETDQSIMSRHYGKECGGYEWWTKEMPLHAGEMCSYHYMGPNTNFHTGAGDRLWADYNAVLEAAARETAWIIECGRTQGVCAFGPWNITCLVNFRLDRETIRPDLGDVTAPGYKPQLIKPHSSEFRFWEGIEKAYDETVANAIQASSFRPFAIIDLSHRRSYYQGQAITRALYVVNDSTADQVGELVVTLKDSGSIVAEQRFPVEVARGRVQQLGWELSLPTSGAGVTYEATFTNTAGEVLDSWNQDWRLTPKQIPALASKPSGDVLLIGSGPSEAWLGELGLEFTTLPSWEGPAPENVSLLILEKETVVPGSQQNQWMEAFLTRGGQALVLEQRFSLFPGLVLENKPQQHAYRRAYDHPALADFTDADFHFWGEDPYASLQSDAHIAHRVYQKDETLRLKPIVDTGEGGFGARRPEWTAIGEMQVGSGRLMTCQLRLTDKASTIPEAKRIFAALVGELVKALPSAPTFVQAKVNEAAEVEAALATAKTGSNAWLRLDGATPEQLAELGIKLGLSLTRHEENIYHGVRPEDFPVLAGISHDDVSGIDSMSYCFGQESFVVAKFALEHEDGLEALLTTSNQSMMTENYVGTGRVEALRTHAASRFLFAEKPKERVLLARVRHGEGWVYLDVFGQPRDTHPRLARYQATLARNLGWTDPANPLQGEAVPAPEERSQGFPRQILRQVVTEVGLRSDLLKASNLPAERMAPSSMFRQGEWDVLEAESGRWNSPGTGETLFYTCLHSPRRRAIVMEDNGIPNPQSLTFLDVTAPSGTVELVINGKSKGSQEIQNDKATFSDLELAESFNQVLLFHRDGNGEVDVHFRFRDIMQNAETELFFLVSQPDQLQWVQAEF